MRHNRRKYSASRARHVSRQVYDSTIGTHVVRQGSSNAYRRSRNEKIARRAHIHRFVIALVAIITVLGLALFAGIMAFRGVVGSAFSLKDSNANDALIAVRAEDPSYTLISIELGAVAEPLENEGPDIIMLARLDPIKKILSLVGIPPDLQITSDNHSKRLASIGVQGDAEMIEAFSRLAKIDISHFVKITDEQDFGGLIDELGGVKVEVSETIDDPHAGSICLQPGLQTLDSAAALTYLRATNIKLGKEGQISNQLDVAAQIIFQLFSESIGLINRLDSIGSFIQTDYSLGDIEGIQAWLSGIQADNISTAILPGYYTVTTNASEQASLQETNCYISVFSDIAELFDKLQKNEHLSTHSIDATNTISPSSFSVLVQNGTMVEGAASAVASLLTQSGFNVEDVGNAENPVYDETIVVYKGSDERGLSCAKAVIDCIGVGRAVDGDIYYSFSSDILVILGADNKPVT